MGTRVVILLLALTLLVGSSHATIAVDLENELGNVKTRIGLGLQPDPRPQKVYAIGELARRLAARLDYSEPIFLEFGRDFGSVPDYFLSFTDGAIVEVGARNQRKPLLGSPGIVIRHIRGPLDVAGVLKLVEHAIRNLESIKSEQRVQVYGKYRIVSISNTQIEDVLHRPMSHTVEKVWRTRVEGRRLEARESCGVSYYFQNGRFVVYSGNRFLGEKPLLNLQDIADFKVLSDSQVLVFDTRTSFYYVGATDSKCSRRHVIEETRGLLEPYEVVSLGRDKIAICFSCFVPLPPWERTGKIVTTVKVKYRVLLYRTEHDELIQDLDEVLDRGRKGQSGPMAELCPSGQSGYEESS